MKRKSQITHPTNIPKKKSSSSFNETNSSNMNINNRSLKNFSNNINHATLPTSVSDNKSIFQYFENEKLKSETHAIKEIEKELKSKSNQITITTHLQNQEKLILDEVHLARKNKELLLINKGLNNHMRAKENYNKKSKFNRENFTEIIFPLVIKSTLGIEKNNERKFKENLFRCKIISNQNTTDECLKLSNSHDYDESKKEVNTIGFISKEISVIIKELMMINYLTIDVLVDSIRIQVYVIVSFNNLAVYSTSVEHVSFLRDGYKDTIDLFRFKSSYLIPFETVKALSEFYSNSKCLNNKLEVQGRSDGTIQLKDGGESKIILDEYLRVLDESFKLGIDDKIKTHLISNQLELEIRNKDTADYSYCENEHEHITTHINPCTDKNNILLNETDECEINTTDLAGGSITETKKCIRPSESSIDSNYPDSTSYKPEVSIEKSKSFEEPSDKTYLHSHSIGHEQSLNDSDEDEAKKYSSYSHFLLMNIEHILSTASNFSFLFHQHELKLTEVYLRDLLELDKEIVSKFLTRSTLWIPKKKLVNLFLHQQEEKTINNSIEKLLDFKLIKGVDSIFEDNIHYEKNSNENLSTSTSSFDFSKHKSEIFTFLFHLNNDELKLIQGELNKLTKYSQKVNANELICDEIYLNNSFFRLNKFVDFGLFKEIIEGVSYSITKFNFEKKSEKDIEDKSRDKFFFFEKNNSKSGNLKYISNFLNATNYKKVKISKFNFTNKMFVIFQIIKTIDIFMNDKSSSLMENFIFTKNKGENNFSQKNLKNDKKEKILKIFTQFNMFILNQTFAKVFDCATRLFFFYSDYKDINDIAKEFYGYENFEKFENFVTNHQILNENKTYLRPIFTTIKEFKLYDNLYQIKNCIIINSMIFNSNELNFEIGINFCFYLMQLTNQNLIEKIFPNFSSKRENDFFNNSRGDDIPILHNKTICDSESSGYKFNNIIPDLNFDSFSKKSFNKSEIEKMLGKIETEENFSDENQTSYLDIIVNMLILSNFNFIEENFLSKYKFRHLAAEILNNFAETCEKLKRYRLAAFIFCYLLLSSSLNKKRGLWWYRLILIYNKYIKNKTICVKLLNITSGDPYIKSGNLVKIKKYFEMFLKEKNKEEKNPKISKKTKGKSSKTCNIVTESKDGITAPSTSKSYLSELDLDIFKTNPEIYDEKLFIDKKRSIQADSVYNKVTGRRLYSLNNTLVTVEDYAIGYYNTLSFQGVHGENAILPALYNIFFWDIIFYDKVPYVFQSPYQTFPLDFFTADFYKNRTQLIDNRCEEISKFSEVDIRNSFEFIFSKKKNIKSVFINWNSIFNDKEVLIKISVAIGMRKLALCFLEFAKNLKFMIKGMPDLFLWKENKTLMRENIQAESAIGSNYNNAKSIYGAIKDSALLVEVKSKNDKLSDYQKYWLHFLTKIDVNVEVLHIE